MKVIWRCGCSGGGGEGGGGEGGGGGVEGGGIDELEKLSFENNPFLFWLLTGVGYNF